jgi:hypothetical protein
MNREAFSALTRVEVVHAVQGAQQCGFATTAGTRDGKVLSRGHCEIDVLENPRIVFAITKRNIAQF